MGFKILYPDTQSSASASSEDASYPASNLLDSKVKKVWRAVSGVSPVTVTIEAGGDDDCIAMFGVVADSAVVTVKNNAGGTVSTHSFNLNAGSRVYTRFWTEYTAQTTSHDIEIALTKASGQIEAGVVRTGTMLDLGKNPKYGLGEGREDQSIVKRLNNGGLYTRLRDIQRVYNPQLFITQSKYYELTDLYDANGPLPLAMLPVDGKEDRQWCLFGHMSKPVDAGFDHPTHVNCAINILEAV